MHYANPLPQVRRTPDKLIISVSLLRKIGKTEPSVNEERAKKKKYAATDKSRFPPLPISVPGSLRLFIIIFATDDEEEEVEYVVQGTGPHYKVRPITEKTARNRPHYFYLCK